MHWIVKCLLKDAQVSNKTQYCRLQSTLRGDKAIRRNLVNAAALCPCGINGYSTNKKTFQELLLGMASRHWLFIIDSSGDHPNDTESLSGYYGNWSKPAWPRLCLGMAQNVVRNFDFCRRVGAGFGPFGSVRVHGNIINLSVLVSGIE